MKRNETATAVFSVFPKEKWNAFLFSINSSFDFIFQQLLLSQLLLISQVFNMSRVKVHKEEDPEIKIKMCEIAKREVLFSDESIEFALGQQCFRCKETYTCPNKMCCRDIFSRSEGQKALHHLRGLIWLKNPGKEVAPPLSKRRQNFVHLLQSMSRTKENKILFCFEGKMVCKSYFKVRTFLLCMLHCLW